MPKVTSKRQRGYRTKPYKKRKTTRTLSTRSSGFGGYSVQKPQGLGFPNEVLATLRYSDQYILNPGTAAGVQVFRLTSVHDPDVTGIGHQPRGHDEYAAVYNHYQVMKTSWRILAHTSDIGESHIFGWCLRRAPTTNSLREYIEAGDCQYRSVAPAGSGGNGTTLTGSVRPHAFLGFAGTQNSRLEANMNVSPDENLYLHVFYKSMRPGTDASEGYVNVELNYDTKFREKKVLAES